MKLIVNSMRALARRAASDLIEEVEAHCEAHPLRYGLSAGLSDAQREELFDRLIHGLTLVLCELEITPEP